jgi:replicative DNA helicase
MFKVAESHDRGGFTWIKDLLWETFENIEKLQKSDGGLTGVASGFKTLDRMTTGLQRGDLVIVAARPSMGKTSWVLNVAQERPSSTRCPWRSSRWKCRRSSWCSGSSAPRRGWTSSGCGADGSRPPTTSGWPPPGESSTPPRSGSTIPRGLGARDAGQGASSEGRSGTGDAGDRLPAAHGGSGRVESRQQEVSQISRGLKGLARELDVPVVALSQLSRGPEQRQDHRPQLSDLRDSGSIEQDADLVMFLFRPEYYSSDGRDAEGNSLEGKAELIVAKQRNGPTGTVDLYFHKAYTRFDDVVPEPAGGPGRNGGGGYDDQDPF